MYAIVVVVIISTVIVALALFVQALGRVGTKKCPSCRERIHRKASVCKHCQTAQVWSAQPAVLLEQLGRPIEQPPHLIPRQSRRYSEGSPPLGDVLRRDHRDHST
jgi:hypothetical protein